MRGILAYMNPYKSLRQSLSLTQVQLAHAAGVTKQVVLLNEAGIYHPPNARIHAYLVSSTGCSGDNLYDQYTTFQATKRFANREAIKNAGAVADTYRTFRDVYKRGTVAGLCKDLCITFVQWSRLENEGGDDGFFRGALRDCGMEWIADKLHK